MCLAAYSGGQFLSQLLLTFNLKREVFGLPEFITKTELVL